MKWKLSVFWKQTLSCTLGTIIGIVLTFGTSAWIENHEKQATERTAALMVIHNLDGFCDDLEETTKYLQTIDSFQRLLQRCSALQHFAVLLRSSMISICKACRKD